MQSIVINVSVCLFVCLFFKCPVYFIYVITHADASRGGRVFVAVCLCVCLFIFRTIS